MPELPEVETIRQDLRKKILNKKIVRVKVYHKTSVAPRLGSGRTGDMSTKFVQALEGNMITEIDRRGKLMVWHLKRGDDLLAVHLKMTGQLIYEKETKNKEHGTKVEIVAGGHKMSERDIDALPNQWTRIAFVFADGGELFFNDLRIFGYMRLETPERIEKALKKFGPEPINSPPARPARNATTSEAGGGGVRGGGSFTFDYFSSLFKKRAKTNIKALLLNQELIAGLGNIYVDEACFCAGVRPMRRVMAVTKAEQQKLFTCIPQILREAIQHRGTTFRNFLDSNGKKGNYTNFLQVYDRDGLPCKRCKSVILKTKVAGRGTHYCPKCQK